MSMSKNFRLFLIIFFLSLPFWWGMNIFQKNLEDFLLSRIMEKNPPSFLIAQISQYYPGQQKPQISAESAISVEVNENGEEQIIFKKEERKKMSIASLTKLMTAVIASEFYSPSLRTEISKKAVSQPEETGQLKIGEILRTEDLLYIMLIESSNDAAFSLAEIIGIEGFTSLMNLKAKDIGMKETFFFNPTGLDSERNGEPYNFSTAEDLVTLAKYILKKPLILEILSKKEYPLYLENGVLHHILHNTNELLGEIPGIIGGKTGFTEKAGGCLILISEGKKPDTYVINIVLNSPNRFQDMKNLIDYAKY